jgi:hypothetical protein
MPAFGPFADAVEARCDGPLLAGNRHHQGCVSDAWPMPHSITAFGNSHRKEILSCPGRQLGVSRKLEVSFESFPLATLLLRSLGFVWHGDPVRSLGAGADPARSAQPTCP